MENMDNSQQRLYSSNRNHHIYFILFQFQIPDKTNYLPGLYTHICILKISNSLFKVDFLTI